MAAARTDTRGKNRYTSLKKAMLYFTESSCTRAGANSANDTAVVAVLRMVVVKSLKQGYSRVSVMLAENEKGYEGV